MEYYCICTYISYIYIYIYTYQYPLTPLAAEGARQRRNYQQQGQQGARRYYKQQGARSKIWQPCVSKLGGGQKKKTASFLSVQKAIGHYRLLPRGPFRPSLPRGLNGCNGCSGHLTHNCLMLCRVAQL